MPEAQAWQCCVPADGSAHAVIVDSTTGSELTPVVEQPHFPAPQAAAPAIVETRKQVAPQPVKEPLQPLEPIAPVSAEKPLTPAPTAAPDTPPAPQPQFKSAAEILAESAEQERMEKAALEAATPPAAPATEPQFKTAAEILAESAAQAELENAAPAPAAEQPMKKASDEQPAVEAEPAPAEPAPKPTPKKPAPQPAEENLFDEADDEPAAEKPAADKPAPMKKAPAEEPVEDLFGEPEAGTPADDKAPAAKESADEPPVDEKADKTDENPFSLLDALPEPVRRWIDATGRHQTIGRLVEVHPDRIRILKSNGHYTTVPLERLSRHDQSYVTQVGERIAAKRPAVTDTAQR